MDRETQATDELIGLVSSVTLDEIQDAEKAFRFIERTAHDVETGRVELHNLAAIRTLAEIHHARLQRQRLEWERAGVLKRAGMVMRARRQRMSDFVRGEFKRRQGR